MRGPEIFTRLRDHAERLAVVDEHGAWTYGDVLDRSTALAVALLDGRHDLHGARAVLLASPGLEYVAALWAIWRAGGVAVPLSPAQPPAEWAQTAVDCRASFAVTGAGVADAMAPVARDTHLRVVSTSVRPRPGALPELDLDRPALMLYTSGTTARPKGVVLTHGAVQAQVESLTSAWEWRPDDRLLHVLPLHHTHGVINALACPMWAGAVCEMLPAFDPLRVWDRLASHDVSVFMAVPTIYQRLVTAWEQARPDQRSLWSDGARQLRLTVSGSAPLPVALFDRWRQITGQSLLERYGMTEVGMALSNPLHGERRAGWVGAPLPGVDVRVVDDQGHDVADGTSGELLVRGPGVFGEYWDRPEATQAAFVDGAWFKTGDVVVASGGAFRVLGRLSVDIIKTGGEKVSALEVEEVLREHPAIQDCAVVGIPDSEWGQSVVAAVVPRHGEVLTIEALREWARPRLAPWKIPTRLLVMSDLPRTALGKVSKPQVTALFDPSSRSA